jgi:NADPH-dependent 2,4-dienoyl-CoA reductase/sulfur reductase-like enzyme/nitrite reductase/ring-hydroxylating ferredoxin subunit
VSSLNLQPAAIGCIAPGAGNCLGTAAARLPSNSWNRSEVKMGGTAEASGPDFSAGMKLDDIAEGSTMAGRVGDEAVLLSRFDGELFAVSGTCTHYGGALAEGIDTGESVRCPLHHACFSLRTGEVHRAPALDPLDRWKVEVEGELAFVRKKMTEPLPQQRATTDVRRIVIIGGGAAGLSCANELRKRGYTGAITMLSADHDPPCDRPNLSKDYLAGNAPEEWIPLRQDDWYRDNDIDLRLGTEVTSIDPGARTVVCSSGERVPFDRLLLATGAEPNRLSTPGFDGDNVFTLRSLADARAIVGRAKKGARAVVIGASFIALEAAASLRHRGVEVDVIAPEQVPFEKALGRDLGNFFKQLHEKNGVRFHLGLTPASFDGRSVEISNGEGIEADFVLVGVGVRPRIQLAEAAPLATGNGVLVDCYLESSAPGIYAAGDIAAFRDPFTGEPTRIEHWVVAERQGQVAAANMLGIKEPFDSAPFFWTEQYGVTVRYVGHASQPQDIKIEGDLHECDAAVHYRQDGRQRATATLNRDRANLEAELELESEREPAC